MSLMTSLTDPPALPVMLDESKKNADEDKEDAAEEVRI